MTECKTEKQSFESALEELRGYSERMQKKDLTLEEALECYEKGMKCYERCEAILESAKFKVDFDRSGEDRE